MSFLYTYITENIPAVLLSLTALHAYSMSKFPVYGDAPCACIMTSIYDEMLVRSVKTRYVKCKHLLNTSWLTADRLLQDRCINIPFSKTVITCFWFRSFF